MDIENLESTVYRLKNKEEAFRLVAFKPSRSTYNWLSLFSVLCDTSFSHLTFNSTTVYMGAIQQQLTTINRKIFSLYHPFFSSFDDFAPMTQPNDGKSMISIFLIFHSLSFTLTIQGNFLELYSYFSFFIDIFYCSSPTIIKY